MESLVVVFGGIYDYLSPLSRAPLRSPSRRYITSARRHGIASLLFIVARDIEMKKKIQNKQKPLHNSAMAERSISYTM